MKITGYEALCNLGCGIEAIYQKAISGDITCFKNIDNVIKDNYIRVGLIEVDLPTIKEDDFNIRANRLLSKNLEMLDSKISNLLNKYDSNRIAIIAATTNSGVEEYETSKKQRHSELGNPALFVKEKLGLNGFYTTVSTACSSGLKAFIIARDLLDNNIADSVIVACVDSLAKVPVYGFHSLEVLSSKPCNPFSKNRSGMNIGEASAIFIVEKEADCGIEVLGLAESSDIFHSTTPDPDAVEAIKAIKMALTDAEIEAKEIDYINAHGTGTIANDIMEANAINTVFSDITPVSSTKPMTGHCLGAGAGIELALCLKLIDSFDGRLYPNVYDGIYDDALKKINLIEKGKKYQKCDICMCNSFGFGGTNTIMIVGKQKQE